MVEINLLPWRQHVFANRKKRKKYFLIGLLGFLVMIFIFVHVLLGWMLKKAGSNVLSLQDKLDQAKSHFSVMEDSGSGARVSILLDKVALNQKKLNSVLSKIAKMGFYHIQIIKMDYVNNQVFLIGRVHSIYELSRWLQDVHVVKIKKMNVEHVRETDLQQFYLVFE